MNVTSKTEKRFLEYYPTPEWPVRRLLERLDDLIAPHNIGKRWLDPCAGKGEIITAVNCFYGGHINWTAIEVFGERLRELRKTVAPKNVIHGNFFEQKLKRYSCIITNPPYTIAYEVAQKSLLLADWVILLLRLEWLGSEKRHMFLSDNTPNVYVLPNRPQYTETGHPSVEYAWFVWPPYNRGHRSRGRLEILDTTPKAIRIRKKHR
jgi:methylase of polypeptide subunit release factors